MEISVIQFVNQRKAELNKFVEQWLENNCHNPDDWPIYLPKADWEEQESMMKEEIQ